MATTSDRDNKDKASAAARGDRRKSAGVRKDYYMIAPAGPGVTRQALIERISRTLERWSHNAVTKGARMSKPFSPIPVGAVGSPAGFSSQTLNPGR